MIYPSHWTSYFGIAKPDLSRTNWLTEYSKVENKKLDELKNNTDFKTVASRFHSLLARSWKL